MLVHPDRNHFLTISRTGSVSPQLLNATLKLSSSLPIITSNAFEIFYGTRCLNLLFTACVVLGCIAALVRCGRCTWSRCRPTWSDSVGARSATVRMPIGVYYGVCIGATWRLRLNRPCASAMWP